MDIEQVHKAISDGLYNDKTVPGLSWVTKWEWTTTWTKATVTITNLSDTSERFTITIEREV